MKKTITAIALLAGAVSGYSQGDINFNNFETGFKQPIYNVQATGNATVTYNGYTVTEEQGSTATATPSGGAQAVTYTGTGLQDSTTGIGYDIQLLAFTGTASSLSQLSLVGGVYNFSTASAGAGYISSAVPVAVTASGGTATIAIAAWNNELGTVTTLAAAQAAGDPWGISELTTINSVVSPATPTAMSTASNLALSFSLGTATPEPSTIALGVIGASTLLFRRRK